MRTTFTKMNKDQIKKEESDDEPGIDDDYDGIDDCKEDKEPAVLNSDFL